MPMFRAKSLAYLETCHPDIQRVMLEVIKYYDCTIVCGHRGKEDQDKAVEGGMSKTPWPNSKHNAMPARAVDAVPYPIDWRDRERFYHFAGFVMAVAQLMGVKLRWGGDWDGDKDLRDQDFFDLPHFELEEA